jgi:hypothetical protein
MYMRSLISLEFPEQSFVARLKLKQTHIEHIEIPPLSIPFPHANFFQFCTSPPISHPPARSQRRVKNSTLHVFQRPESALLLLMLKERVIVARDCCFVLPHPDHGLLKLH